MTGKVLKLLSVLHLDFELVAARVERSLCIPSSIAYLWEWQNLCLLQFHSKECGFFTFWLVWSWWRQSTRNFCFRCGQPVANLAYCDFA